MVGANADGRLEVFYVGTNDQLFHRVQLPAGGWSDELTSGLSGRELAIAANSDGRLELFYAAMNGALSHTWQTAANSTWSGGALLSGSVAPWPAATPRRCREPVRPARLGRRDRAVIWPAGAARRTSTRS